MNIKVSFHANLGVGEPSTFGLDWIGGGGYQQGDVHQAWTSQRFLFTMLSPLCGRRSKGTKTRHLILYALRQLPSHLLVQQRLLGLQVTQTAARYLGQTQADPPSGFRGFTR